MANLPRQNTLKRLFFFRPLYGISTICANVSNRPSDSLRNAIIYGKIPFVLSTSEYWKWFIFKLKLERLFSQCAAKIQLSESN
jgi:hypothetical protein